MNTDTSHPLLSDLPLWRLLVALDDAERTAGSDSPTARVLARVVLEKLRLTRGEFFSRDERRVSPCR